MPASLHKMIIHGHNIIDTLSLPIGLYSEESGESRNKNTKTYRLYQSRKDTRIHTQEEQIHICVHQAIHLYLFLRQKVKNKKKYLKRHII